MYHKDSVAIFLADMNAQPDVVQAVEARIAEVVNGEGLFSGGKLDFVLGDTVVGDQFREAWERNPRLRDAGR